MKTKMKLCISILSLLAIFGCAKTEDAKTVTKYIGCTKALENQGDCIRWMDRKIYFAFSNTANPNRNNEFQKAKVKEALAEIQNNTLLGKDYFQYQEVDESLLHPVVEPGLSPSQYKSFILIWPDNVCNEYVVNNLGGNIQVTPSRETTTYTLSFEPSKLNEAVDLLGDILLNSVYNKN